MAFSTVRNPAIGILVLSLHAAMLAFLLERDRWPIPEQTPAGANIVFVHIAPPPPTQSAAHRDRRPPRVSGARAAAPAAAPFVVQPFTSRNISIARSRWACPTAAIRR
jgi:hypothetical protein